MNSTGSSVGVEDITDRPRTTKSAKSKGYGLHATDGTHRMSRRLKLRGKEIGINTFSIKELPVEGRPRHLPASDSMI